MGWANYSDIDRVYEISAVYDDTLKKNNIFTDYAVKIANRILEDLGITALATYGKWGARIEPAVNPHLTEERIEEIAKAITEHHSWTALMLSTYVFTFGEYNDEISEYQEEAKIRAEETARKAHEYVKNLIGKK